MARRDRTKWHDIAVQLDSTAADLLQTAWRVRDNDPEAFAKTAIGCLVRKAHTDFHAMLLLCENGLSDSAQILARCVLESCLNLLYIEQKPAERGELFWAYGIHQRVRLGEQVEKAWGLTPYEQRKDTEFRQFINSSEKKWPRLKQIVKALGQPIEAKLHGIVYDSLSSNAHGLALTLEGWYMSDAPHEKVISRAIGDTHSFSYIDILCMFFAGALSAALKTFGIETPSSLSGIIDVMGDMAFPDGIPENEEA